MSDTEKTPGKGGAAATGAAWTDTERVKLAFSRVRLLLRKQNQMAYLIVIAEHALDAPIESKISVRISPIPLLLKPSRPC